MILMYQDEIYKCKSLINLEKICEIRAELNRESGDWEMSIFTGINAHEHCPYRLMGNFKTKEQAEKIICEIYNAIASGCAAYEVHNLA